VTAPATGRADPRADPPLDQVFAGAMGALLGPDFPRHLGLAVSGGGDSMVMLHLAADWARVYGIALWVVTIDHGLRPDSAAEAALVAEQAADRGLPHSTLHWVGRDGSGNLQDAARSARLDLIGRWRGVVRHVLMAHTQDDQAETFLLRLARGSGVEGLAAMAPQRRVATNPGPAIVVPGGPPASVAGTATATETATETGTLRPAGNLRSTATPAPNLPLTLPATPSATPPAPLSAPLPPDWFVLRPLLTVSRAALRHHARVLHIPYIDDPSNDDPRFDRVRMRALLDPLADHGLTRARLADTAARLRRAQGALAARAHDVATRIAGERMGCILFDRDAMAGIEADTQLRLLAAAIQTITSDPYRPRESALESALDRVLGGGAANLGGAMLVPQGAALWIAREHAAIAGQVAQAGPDAVWDRRWHLHGPAIDAMTIRALGPDGLAQVVRPAGVPVPVMLALPSVWQGGRLVACRDAAFGPEYRQDLHPPGGTFPNRLFSH